MATPLSKTAAQMTADGFALLYGEGERIQMWGGATGVNNDEAAFRVFDSARDLALPVPDSSPERFQRAGLAAVVLDLISASALSDPEKQSLRAVVLQSGARA